MPKRPRPASTSRSEHWLRLLVEKRPELFQRRFAEITGSSSAIEWLSPVRSDGYAEYYDAAFLERLGLHQLSSKLKDYWPASGPRWDGLARTEDGQVILIEAKAHLGEVISDCEASEASLKRIREQLENLKAELGVPQSRHRVSWLSPYYQFCNRIAHLHFLHRNNVKAHLVFIQFADAPDVPKPMTPAMWSEFSQHIREALALRTHALSGFDHDLTISVRELQA